MARIRKCKRCGKSHPLTKHSYPKIADGLYGDYCIINKCHNWYIMRQQRSLKNLFENRMITCMSHYPKEPLSEEEVFEWVNLKTRYINMRLDDLSEQELKFYYDYDNTNKYERST